MDVKSNQDLENIRDNLVRLTEARGSGKSTPESGPPSEPTEEVVRRMKRRRLANAGVPARFLGVDRMSIDPLVWKRCEPLLDGGPDGVFLCGPVGCGKTHLAVALLREVVQGSIRFLSVPELMLRLRESFRDGARSSEGDIIDACAGCDLLVLDDLGVEKPSEFAVQSLYLVVDRRYSEMRRTVITSNFTIGEIAERVGDRIASRIAGMCRVVELQGEDRRVR